jgi:hypothetical protein
MLRSGRRDRVALLFCGKTALEDVPILSALTTAGVVDRPAYMPPPLANSAALGRLLTALPTRSPSLQPPHLFDEVFVSPLAALPHAALSFQDDARMAEP